jgi:RHS repeat-associated protein
MGFGADGPRQKFTGYEREDELGLDFARARYYGSVQGRFTSIDPLTASSNVNSPQSFNRYAYVLNNPVNATDPTGMSIGLDPFELLEDGPFLRMLEDVEERLQEGQKQQETKPPSKPDQQPSPQQPDTPGGTQTATRQEPPNCGLWGSLCTGQIPTTVTVQQDDKPGVFKANVKGTESVVAGVGLVFTFLDQDGKPVDGSVMEFVHPTAIQADKPLQLVGGKVSDLVSNSFGSVPATQSEMQRAMQFLNEDFSQNQIATFLVVPKFGVPAVVTHVRSLTNTVSGAPRIGGGAIRGYTFTMQRLEIRPVF